jgi:hypothetical protein
MESYLREITQFIVELTGLDPMIVVSLLTMIGTFVAGRAARVLTGLITGNFRPISEFAQGLMDLLSDPSRWTNHDSYHGSRDKGISTDTEEGKLVLPVKLQYVDLNDTCVDSMLTRREKRLLRAKVKEVRAFKLAEAREATRQELIGRLRSLRNAA